MESLNLWRYLKGEIMENELIREIVNGHMKIYKEAIEEGRKIGYQEGYKIAWAEIQPIIDELKKLLGGVNSGKK